MAILIILISSCTLLRDNFGFSAPMFDTLSEGHQLRRPAGGDSSGGGSTRPFHDLDGTEVTEAISAVPIFISYIFQWQEVLSRQFAYTQIPSVRWAAGKSLLGTKMSEHELSHYLRLANEKIFADKGRLKNLLQGLHFVARQHGPCLDRQYQEKDGSAFNADPNEICLSVERIKKAVVYENLLPEVMALAAHEIVHRAGGNEMEAIAFQAAVLSHFKMVSLTDFQSQIDHRVFILKLIDLDKIEFESYAVDQLKHDVSVTEFCMNIVEWEHRISGAIQGIIDDGRNQGYLVISPDGIAHLTSMQLQIGAIRDYCVPGREQKNEKNGYGSIPTSLIKYQPRALPSNAVIELESIEVDRGDSVNFVTPGRSLSGRVVFVRFMNISQAVFNYGEALKNFSQVSQELEYVSDRMSRRKTERQTK